MNITAELLDQIVRAANDAGKGGRRIHGVWMLPARTPAQTDHFVFDEDDGPRTAAEAWRGNQGGK